MGYPYSGGESLIAADVNKIMSAGAQEGIITAEDLLAGQPVGLNVNGQLSLARNPMRTAALGVTSTTGLSRDSVCSVNTGKLVMTYKTATGLYVRVAMQSATSNNMTLSADQLISATGYMSTIVKLDTDKFIIIYSESGATTILKYVVGTVNGTTITLGTPATFITGATAITSFSTTYLSQNKGVMVDWCATNTDSRVAAFTVSGTVATIGTPVAVDTGTLAGINLEIVKVNTDTFVFSSAGGLAQAGTCIGGTTITLGTGVSNGMCNVNYSGYMFQMVGLPNGLFVVMGHLDGNAYKAVVAGSVSGTTISMGTIWNYGATEGAIWKLFVESDTSVRCVRYGGGNDTEQVLLNGTTLTVNRDIPWLGQWRNYSFDHFVSDGTTYYGVQISGANFNYGSQNMTNNYIGFVSANASAGTTPMVFLHGKDTNQTGLVTGSRYTVTNGTLKLVDMNTTDYFSGYGITINLAEILAVSSTEILF